MRSEELRIDGLRNHGAPGADLIHAAANLRIVALEREVDALHRELDQQRDARHRDRRQARQAAMGNYGDD